MRLEIMRLKLRSEIIKTDSDNSIKFIEADVSDALESIEDKSIDLVLTSPPYNLRKIYERDRKMSLDQYISWLEPIIKKICNKITDNGSICWQVGNYINNGEVFPLDYYFYKIFNDEGLKLRNRIIWQFNFGLHAVKRLSGRYETLLWLTKSDDYIFNLDAIRVPQLYPGKRYSVSKGAKKAGKPSGNPLGKIPTDYWEFSAEEYFKEDAIWKIPNVKANHPEKTIHPCQFPHELAERCILAFTKKNDKVLDPFVGAGTTAVAAAKSGRSAVVIDKDSDYIALSKQRLKQLLDGTLQLRLSGKKIVKPNTKDRVARVPIEWNNGEKL